MINSYNSTLVPKLYNFKTKLEIWKYLFNHIFIIMKYFYFSGERVIRFYSDRIS